MPQYQGVWTLQQQAQAQSTQQWVTDPNFKNTVLLLQADGVGSGSQNNTFFDSSTNNFFITRNGNTTQGSFSPFSQAPGYWSNYFDGSSAKLTLPSNAVFSFGTGAYTVEFWIYFISIAGTDSRVFDAGSASGSFGVSIDNTNAVNIAKYGTGYVVQSPARALPSNQWAHVAVVRDSTSTNATRIYINGSLVVTGTDNNNWTVTTTPSICGLDLSLYNPQCYLSNLRVVKGGSLYTSNFTPTTTPLSTTVSSGTVSLLTCQSNRFVDNSVNAFTITTVSTPSVQAFGPFVPALQWTSNVVGGSGYFYGTSDYLTVPQSTNLDFGSGDFTIEAFVYPTNFNSNFNTIVAKMPGATSYAYRFRFTSSTIYFGYSTSGSNFTEITVSYTFSLNTWYHIAVSRSGNNLYFWVNGQQAGATQTLTATIYPISGATAIGTSNDNPTNNVNIQGYLGSLRILKGTALYTTSFTPPTTPLTAITNTQLLMNFTSAGLYDGTMNGVFQTVADAQVSTGVVKYGSGSLSCVTTVSTGSYLAAQQTTNLYALYTGDFTVEGWVYLNTSSFDYSGPGAILNYGNGGANGPLGNYTAWFLYINNGATGVRFYRYDGTETYYEFLGSIPIAQWVHIALTRANGFMRAFVNGSQIGSTTTVTLNYAPVSGTNRMLVGLQTGGGGANQYYRFPGYMDDLRVTKGVARYIANFTPPQQALPRQ